MSSNKKIEIITSWDDGNVLDLEIAKLLLEYEVPGVFYIPVKCDLQEYQIRQLIGLDSPPDCKLCEKKKQLFEIGAHTVNHPNDLKKLDDDNLYEEIAGSKGALEKITGKKVDKFCYPRGRYDSRVKGVIKTAGFKEARTTKSGTIEFSSNPFITNPTVHANAEKTYSTVDGEEFYNLAYEEPDIVTWKEFAEDRFDKVIREGGRFELWGHGWEIEKYNMWEFLEDFLAYVGDKLKEINYFEDGK